LKLCLIRLLIFFGIMIVLPIFLVLSGPIMLAIILDNYNAIKRLYSRCHCALATVIVIFAFILSLAIDPLAILIAPVWLTCNYNELLR